jgi:hypothetical protein
MAIMMRAGSRAFTTATTASGFARLKYGSMNSSRRPFGGSKIGTLRFSDQAFSHCWKRSAIPPSVCRLTGYNCRYASKNPITLFGCWNGWINPFSRIRSKQRYAKRMLSLWCS